jgi:MerR family copper efflux transcriptional regulator
MKPLGFTLQAMSAAMRDIETLQQPVAAPAENTAAHQRLVDILKEAAERRAKLVRQLAMADEFIDRLGQNLT